MKAFSKMTPEELSSFMGAHAEVNREDSFLNKQIIPWLKNEADTLNRTNRWRKKSGEPAPDLITIGANTVWNSGIIEGLELLITELDRIKRLANEARAELKRREDKAEKEKKQ